MLLMLAMLAMLLMLLMLLLSSAAGFVMFHLGFDGWFLGN